jgi:hypothetical protein
MMGVDAEMKAFALEAPRPDFALVEAHLPRPEPAA